MLKRSAWRRGRERTFHPYEWSWVARLYDLTDAIPERWVLSRWRARLWMLVGSEPGRLLEVGVGTGRNFPYYPSGTEVFALDISQVMIRRAEIKRQRLGVDVTLLVGDLHSLPFPAESFDTVVSSFLFCTVSDPQRGFREVWRVLRPGGRAFFLEHMRPETPSRGRLFDVLDPLVVRMMGDHINRRTVQNLLKGGFRRVKVVNLTKGGVVRLLMTEKEPRGEAR